MINDRFGRISLTRILSSINNFQVLWIPDLTCSAIVLQLENSGINFCYYNTKNGAFDENSLNSIVIENKDVLLVTHHFGKIESISSQTRSKFLAVIEDYTQVLLSWRDLRNLPLYSFSSYRKYTNLKIGSLSVLNNFNKPYLINTSFLTIISITKSIVLEIDLFKWIYNFVQYKNSSSHSNSQIITPINANNLFPISFLESLIIKWSYFKLSITSIYISNFLFRVFGLITKNDQYNSFFCYIDSNKISQRQISSLRYLGFRIYKWPDLCDISHTNAFKFRENHAILGYDVPIFTFTIILIEHVYHKFTRYWF
jgi:hypothetical protein